MESRRQKQASVNQMPGEHTHTHTGYEGAQRKCPEKTHTHTDILWVGRDRLNDKDISTTTTTTAEEACVNDRAEKW